MQRLRPRIIAGLMHKLPIRAAAESGDTPQGALYLQEQKALWK
jgi:hypothetical protein